MKPVTVDDVSIIYENVTPMVTKPKPPPKKKNMNLADKSDTQTETTVSWKVGERVIVKNLN